MIVILGNIITIIIIIIITVAIIIIMVIVILNDINTNIKAPKFSHFI